MKIQLTLIASLLTVMPSYAADTVSVSSIEWCPQLCTEGNKPGYVMDTVNEIFRDSPYKLDVHTYPWTRAINQVESGRSHALLSPAKNEAPSLKFPEHEVGLQRMCFFTKSDSSWNYDGPESLSNMKIGIASDTSIEELNNFIAKNAKQFDFLPYGENYIKTSLKKLEKNRIDTFVFTLNSTKYKINELSLSNEYRDAGCVSSAKIYMAFTPNGNVDEVMKYFDKRMIELKESGKIGQIMSAYGLEDWQNYL